VNYFSWMDPRKVTRAQDKVKGTDIWQITYLTPYFLNFFHFFLLGVEIFSPI
jgi:hypothetical protein